MKKKIYTFVLITLALSSYACKSTADKQTKQMAARQSLSVDNNRVSIYSKNVVQPLRIVFAADTHLAISDKREDDFRQYSARMGDAYKVTKHFQTGKEMTTRQAFLETIHHSKKSNADLLVLSGDIINFPSEAAVEWCSQKLDSAKVNYSYTAGNHDWHYEGMSGSSIDLRDKWISERLMPLYPKDTDPLMYYVDVKDVRVLMIDNSVYEILPKQLAFLQEQIKTGKPLLICMHIPLYAKGRTVGYGCGHPEWNASTDPSYEIERREKWPEQGHSETTYKFRQEIEEANNVLAVFCGHIHTQTVDMIGNVPQFVAKMNATGAYYDIFIYPDK